MEGQYETEEFDSLREKEQRTLNKNFTLINKLSKTQKSFKVQEKSPGRQKSYAEQQFNQLVSQNTGRGKTEAI